MSDIFIGSMFIISIFLIPSLYIWGLSWYQILTGKGNLADGSAGTIQFLVFFSINIFIIVSLVNLIFRNIWN